MLDETLGRNVAAKLLMTSLKRHPGLADRLQFGWMREIATIDNRGVVHVYDAGVDPETGAYVIMDHEWWPAGQAPVGDRAEPWPWTGDLAAARTPASPPCPDRSADPPTPYRLQATQEQARHRADRPRPPTARTRQNNPNEDQIGPVAGSTE